MRVMLLTTAVLILASPALGSIQFGNAIDLSHKGLGDEPAYDDREGGETIADAFVVGSIPFTDTGATCDNIHDYDETCPCGSSSSPDVVYVFAANQAGGINIDLCGSLYDTKLIVYDFEGGYGFGNPLACNDDAGCGSSGYQSRVSNVPVEAGHSYHIIVTGYMDTCGEYLLSVDWFLPCTLDCPPGAGVEGEPALVDGYLDTWNGGCNSLPTPPFHWLCGDLEGALMLCCNAGNCSYQGAQHRDADWFGIFMAGHPCAVTAEAEFPTYILQLGFDLLYRCQAEVTVQQTMLLEPGVSQTMEFAGEIPDEVWVWGGAAGWENYPEYTYILSFQGIDGFPRATDTTSWSTIKTLFR